MQTAVVYSIIFSELKNITQRKVRIVTQSLVSGFNFTTDFPENVFSAQSLSTKFGSVFNFHARFSVIIYSEKVGEKPSA